MWLRYLDFRITMQLSVPSPPCQISYLKHYGIVKTFLECAMTI